MFAVYTCYGDIDINTKYHWYCNWFTCAYILHIYIYIYTYAQWDQGKKAFFARRVNLEEEKPSAAAVLVLMCFLTTFYRTNPDFFCLIVSQKYHAFVWQ